MRAAYRRRSPPLDPVGGAVLTIEQLTNILNLAPRDLKRLQEAVTALPGDSKRAAHRRWGLYLDDLDADPASL